MNTMKIELIQVRANEPGTCDGCVFNGHNNCPNQSYGIYEHVPCVAENRYDLEHDMIWVVKQ